MDKERKEFEECDAVFWDPRPFLKAKYFSYDPMIDSTHMIQARTEFRLGWQAAQTAMQPKIDKLASDKDELNDLVEKQEQLLSAANQRIKELEERIRAADAEKPVAYIAWLFERNSMWGVEWYAAEGMDSSWTKNADKAIKFPSKESLLEICEHRWDGRKLPFTLEGGGDWEYNYYAAEHMFNCGIASDLHAQIPAEVELKAKIAELEAIIKASKKKELQ